MYICEACHKEFTPKHSRPSRQPRFCCISCANSTKRRETETNFWSYVEKTDNCWLWKGGKSKPGYGYFSINGKTHKAHRTAYELTYHATLESSTVVCHKCDNPSCVRPDHLFVGTHRDNAHDAFQKGRRNIRFAESSHPGAQNGRAKLSDQDVRNIRKLARNGITVKQLVSMYPVCQTQINKVIRGTGWKHVSEDGEC